jgi:hypothetical protein
VHLSVAKYFTTPLIYIHQARDYTHALDENTIIFVLSIHLHVEFTLTNAFLERKRRPVRHLKDL